MRLNAEQRKKIAELLNEDHSVAEIAARLGVHRSSVYRHIQKLENNRTKGVTDYSLSTRVSAAEQVRVEALARRLGYGTRSKFLRAIVRKVSGFFEEDPSTFSELEAIKESLRRIGNNVNQIATNHNTSMKKLGYSETRKEELAELHALEDQIEDVKILLGHMVGNSQVRLHEISQLLTEASVAEKDTR